MKGLTSICLLLLLASAAHAWDNQDTMTAWEWYKAVSLPEPGASPYVDFIVTPSIFDKARLDLADLRLFGANGKEIPYALRIRRPIAQQEPLSGRLFNQVKNADRSAEVTVDLGKKPNEHNQVDILTTGKDFRRHVELRSSSDGNAWSTLVERFDLVRFKVDMEQIDVHTIHYSSNRQRYLQVHVSPEAGNEKDAPAISSVVVSQSILVAGELLTGPAVMGSREPVRTPSGNPGSAWKIDFGGETAPCERLSFDVLEPDFARPFTLEALESDGSWRALHSGLWRRQAGSERKPLLIEFPEVIGRGFRLTVTDFRNPPLTIKQGTFMAAARQIVFPRAEAAAPVNLFFGNAKAEAPHYDFAASLPLKIQPAPARAVLEAQLANPIYQPEPKPWTERWPWMIYLVLGFASVFLMGILFILAREALARSTPETVLPA